MSDAMKQYAEAVQPDLVLDTTPARVCTRSGAIELHSVILHRVDGSPNEQYFKWQLVDALIRSGRVPASHIACELAVPRGSSGSTDLFIDVVIFSSERWVQIYNSLVSKLSDDWDELTNLIVACGEVKADSDDDADKTVARQLIPALKATSGVYTLGFYYNAGHLALFSRESRDGEKIERIDPGKQLRMPSRIAALNLSVPDAYGLFPALDRLEQRRDGSLVLNRASRRVEELDVVTGRSQGPVEAAVKAILRILDHTSMGSEVGYRIVIEALAVKIFDEYLSELSERTLRFYIDDEERPQESIRGAFATYRDRIKDLHNDARDGYPVVLGKSTIRWDDPAHLRIIAEVTYGFQDISLRRSAISDLYQVVFYNFAGPLSKAAQAQFMTPLRVIDFMVELVNPQEGESVCDPTMGIADFLAQSFRKGAVRASDLYGLDNDPNMVMLAGLNMLLNGDGDSNLFTVPDSGSLDSKLVKRSSGTIAPLRLDATANAEGNWNNLDAGTRLHQFNIVLTNPPFGDGRALKYDEKGAGSRNREIAKLYEIPSKMGGNQIDKGILFLENAIRSIKPGGRFGIVLSASIASVAEYRIAREWLLANSRIVALFDMPKDMFAETGVPTSIFVGYKPLTRTRLAELQKSNYSVFAHEITRIGFSKSTRNRTTFLVDRYEMDPLSGMVRHDPVSGEPIIDEEFSEVTAAFRTWALTQEDEVRTAFAGGAE